MRPLIRYTIQEFLDLQGESPFRHWIESLDLAFRARIQARILRFEEGNLGDIKSVGKGVNEARLNFGPGFRVYFGFDGTHVVILLAGGDKSTQGKDIKWAQKYWSDYLEEKKNG